jgi:hypothetical protein
VYETIAEQAGMTMAEQMAFRGRLAQADRAHAASAVANLQSDRGILAVVMNAPVEERWEVFLKLCRNAAVPDERLRNIAVEIFESSPACTFLQQKRPTERAGADPAFRRNATTDDLAAAVSRARPNLRRFLFRYHVVPLRAWQALVGQLLDAGDVSTLSELEATGLKQAMETSPAGPWSAEWDPSALPQTSLEFIARLPTGWGNLLGYWLSDKPIRQLEWLHTNGFDVMPAFGWVMRVCDNCTDDIMDWVLSPVLGRRCYMAGPTMLLQDVLERMRNPEVGNSYAHPNNAAHLLDPFGSVAPEFDEPMSPETSRAAEEYLRMRFHHEPQPHDHESLIRDLLYLATTTVSGDRIILPLSDDAMVHGKSVLKLLGGVGQNSVNSNQGKKDELMRGLHLIWDSIFSPQVRSGGRW